ncbi:MerR family transcriptional regulator [Kibdelosporangium persicum]|uniref:DNA-binding transcriptional MerR regulator n=1 Tax=Kibdelosporangium persicum TaxID=2698649 RepID=A0ABX2EWJ3_9PSEU|nr:MerR family transcriptional regulator [Kibdelosporangium persicum]NRN63075.1 DNA-binding transcriptional MerR regulator [Kibdelosporangium persicum]
MTEHLLPIGEFARMCRLSTKQLRHYDSLGLLTPAEVDASTGYRYYSATQARRALAIALLRKLDVPLPEIAEALRDERVLGRHLGRVEAEIEHRRRTARALTRLLDEGLLRQEVSLVQEPARRLVVHRTVCALEEIGSAVGHGMRALADLPGPRWGLFPLDLDASELTVAAGVETDAPGGDVEQLPAGLVAMTTHVGPYEDLTLAYQGLFAWIYERGHRPLGPAREAYLAGPLTSTPEQLVTRLIIPLEQNHE